MPVLAQCIDLGEGSAVGAVKALFWGRFCFEWCVLANDLLDYIGYGREK